MSVMPRIRCRNRPDILFLGLRQASMLLAEPVLYCLGSERWRVWMVLSQPRP
jgi:hypothetical protein